MENKKAEDIIIAASTQQTVINELEDFARQRGKHLVLLNDKVITDYIKSTEQAEKQPPATVESFLQNERNREEAETKAISLFNLITHNGDILNSKDRVFKKSDVTKKTNLTHKTLGELLTLFSLFGLIEWKRGDYEFSFVFSKEVRQASALADITNTTTMLNQNIVRYLSQFSDVEKKEKLNDIRKEIIEAILK